MLVSDPFNELLRLMASLGAPCSSESFTEGQGQTVPEVNKECVWALVNTFWGTF